MKTKDLVYVGVIAYLAYLLMKKKPLPEISQETTSNVNNPVAGNSTNGGLNLGQNMDLPNLTPTSPNGMSTETALNSSNINPLIKDDEPTQVFGNYNLPTPYGVSTISANPFSTLPASNSSTVEYPTANTTEYPTTNTIASPVILTSNYETVENIPNPIIGSTSIIAEPILNNPRLTPVSEISIEDNLPVYNSPRPELVGNIVSPTTEDVMPVYNSPRPELVGNIVSPITEDVMPVYNSPRPIISGSSIISQPTFELGSTTSLSTNITEEPILNSPEMIIPEPVKDELISECGNSFSIPNNDKEGSYTNYWFDGSTFFMQTTSPLIKTISIKINKDLFVEGCKKFQVYKSKNA